MPDNYWETTISEAAEECGLDLTPEQLDTLASWVEGAHENYGMAMGYDCIPNPLRLENEELQRKLQIEQQKSVCPRCNGSGIEVVHGPCHDAISQCFTCKGDGKA